MRVWCVCVCVCVGGVWLSPQEEIARVLESKVDDMVARAERERDVAAESCLPLIRLKVDYTGFSTINSQRFGHRLVERVANPFTVLQWSKQAREHLPLPLSLSLISCNVLTT